MNGTILFFQGHMSLLNARVTALNDLLNALIPHAGGN